MLKKLLIANRGEIALRIVRACKELSIRSVAVFSEADKAALHTQHADEAYSLGPSQPSESYLNIQKIIDVAMTFQVKVDGEKFALRLDPRRRKRHNRVSEAEIAPPHQILARKKTKTRSGAVVSVMPGRIVLLKVKTGDKVKVSDPLCILEAMKMENEILAPRNGTITEIGVKQGAYVNKGDLLFVIE